jgi:uncharacterized protein (TIGR03435 family)
MPMTLRQSHGYPSLVVIMTMLVVGRVSAQEARFEQATVQRSTGNGDAVADPLADGRFVARNATLRYLLARAYGLHDSQLLNTPDWAAIDRFDIAARGTTLPPEGPEALLPAVRDLLSQQFKIRAHVESRALAAYVLTVKQRGRLGSFMRPTQADCSAGRAPLTSKEVRALAIEGGWPPCGLVFVNLDSDPGDPVKTRRVRRSAITTKDLAIRFQDTLEAPVIDRTELAGRFDVEYTFADVAGDTAPFVVAIDEQLGLTLERQRIEVPVLVVDAVERPVVAN